MARQARDRRGAPPAGRTSDGDRRHRPKSPHCLPAIVPQAGRRRGIAHRARLLGSGSALGRAARRRRTGLQPQPHRRRDSQPRATRSSSTSARRRPRRRSASARSKAGQRLPGPWIVDGTGHPTDDPRPLVEDKSGALYPLGGADLGYKGFALGVLLEAITSALAGHGRHAREARWGCSVFLMLIDPANFGGRAAFARETSWLADASRAATVAPGQPAVRMPGDHALLRRADQLANGVALHPRSCPHSSCAHETCRSRFRLSSATERIPADEDRLDRRRAHLLVRRSPPLRLRRRYHSGHRARRGRKARRQQKPSPSRRAAS